MLEIGETIDVPGCGPLVIESIAQRNWSRVGVATGPDGRYFVKQFVDRIGRRHARGFEGDRATLAEIGECVGGVNVVPVIGRLDERLITVSPNIEMYTVESISGPKRRGLEPAQRIGQAMADILTSCAIDDRSGYVRIWKGIDPKNIGWTEDGTMWVFDFGPPAEVPLDIAAARVVAAGLLSRWVAKPGRHLISPERWLVRGLCEPVAPMTSRVEVEKILQEHHDLRQREPQRTGMQAMAIRAGLNTLGRIHWRVLRSEAARLLPE
ncbi:MAG: hypothetical protein AAF548_15495 [Actinomycetota bacterium]